jgi:hypothetical protein
VGLGSLKLVECLAAGRPVVAADSPLHRELAGLPPAAVFFRPGDAGELAGKLQQLAKDPAQRAQLADRARSRARSAFDAGLARKAVLRAYYDLLDPSVVVTADAYAAPERAGSQGGDDPTSTQAEMFDIPVPEPETNPAAGESTTNVSRVSPPVRDEHTPIGTAPATVVVPPPAELTPPAGLHDPTGDTSQSPDEPDWFSAHLPPEPGSSSGSTPS